MKGVYPYQYKKNKQKDSIIMNTEKVAQFSPVVAQYEVNRHRASLVKGGPIDPQSLRKAEYNRRKSTVGSLSSLEEMDHPLKQGISREEESFKAD